MESYEKVIDAFIEKWGRNVSVDPESTEKVGSAETRLGFEFPAPYKYLLSKSIRLHTPGILDKIVDLELDINDVQNFSDPADLIEETQAYEKAGMPSGYLGFAIDCMGNMFLFKIEELKIEANVAIYFFDHDFITVESVSPSFEEWISQYNGI